MKEMRLRVVLVRFPELTSTVLTAAEGFRYRNRGY
jgi:hypothetical protein